MESVDTLCQKGIRTPNGGKVMGSNLPAKTCFKIMKTYDSLGSVIDQRFCLLLNYFGTCFLVLHCNQLLVFRIYAKLFCSLKHFANHFLSPTLCNPAKIFWNTLQGVSIAMAKVCLLVCRSVSHTQCLYQNDASCDHEILSFSFSKSCRSRILKKFF